MRIRDDVKRLPSWTLFAAMVLSVMQTGFQSCRLEAAEPGSANQAATETNALLLKPLEQSHKDKVWPDDPLRGFQTYSFTPSGDPVFLNEETFKKFKAWNINVIRLWIEVDPDSTSASADDPVAPYRKNLEGLRIALALAEKHHIYIIPVAGGVVGRSTDALSRETSQGSCYPGLVALWEYIARNFGDHPWLLGYDLLNEPNTKNEVDSWHATMLPQLIERVRAIDRNTFVIVETAPWSLPDQAFPPSLTPLKDPKAIYSFHFYYPHGYTHQGLYTYKGDTFEHKRYPGMLRMFESSAPMYWNKDALEDSMKGAIEFQKKYGVKIFVGEFGVIRWAPGAARWLSDVIEIFEKHHFSWTYHCYGYWNGWNPTFSADAPESAVADGGVETDRMKTLIKAWTKNKKPARIVQSASGERHDMVKDHLWIWAHDSVFYGSGSGLPGVAHMTPIEGAFFMGIPNVMFIRYQGIPEPPFEQYTVPFRSLRSFEWSLLNNNNETSHLGTEQEHVYALAAKRPNMTGVIMDDFIMRPGGEATAGPWLADNNPRFPVVLSLKLPEPCRVTSVELTQTSWPSGDYRTGRFEVEASSDGSVWKQVFKDEMPNMPGAQVSVPLGDMMLSNLRISVLSTHDESGSLSCGLGSIRLLSGDSPVPIHDAIVSATSEFPTHESTCLTLEPGEKRTILPKLMLTPEELGEARKRLDNINGRRLDLSVVVYTHQMEAGLAHVLDACDFILLWTWRPEDIKNMPANLAKARRLFPGKRIRLGCYMWDFSVGKPLPLELMKWQCDFALRSLRAGEIEGIIFLGTNICDLGIDTVEWTREWVLRVGETALEAR